MTAQDALQSGDLEDALAKLLDEVRAEPEQAKHRVFLFQLLSVKGDWDRALTHLNVARELDAGALMMAQTYQELLQCEALRKEVFAGKRTPLMFGDPLPWLAQMLEALRLDGEGKHDAAQSLREAALEQANPVSGSVTLNKGDDEQSIPFEWLADADTRLGPVLEMVVNGRYYWAPFERIAEISIDPPEDLRDLVWTPVHFRWANEGETVGVIPTRYVGADSSDDDAIKLSRKTEWRQVGEQGYEGSGQRVFVTDSDEYGLLDLRKITLNCPPPGAEAESTE